jgi:hypothetical protein
MAPLLISVLEHQQDELLTPATMSKKFTKPVVPAVPRLFEKRRVTSNVKTPSSGSVIGEKDERKHGAFQSSAEDTPVISATQYTPKRGPEGELAGPTAALYVPENVAISESQGTFNNIYQICCSRSLLTCPEDEISSTSTVNRSSGNQGYAFQLPPAFYPTPAQSNPTIYPISPFRADGFLDQPQPRNFSPYVLDRNIVFGGEPESSQSSPRSMPSAGSTTYTQPTPLSDATSCRSQSLYQGYGHLPNTYERYVPSKLVYSPPEDHYPQPVHTSPPGSDYAIPPPQIPSSSQLPPRHVFAQLPAKGEIALPDPLKTFLLQQFNNPEFADCSLQMEIEGQATTFMLHGVVIAQNPMLKALLQSVKSFDSDGRKALTLGTIDSYLSLPVVTSALRSCYGETLPQDSLAVNELDHALAYLATGQLFQMPKYQDIGITGILNSLTSDNLETVLSYALSHTANPVSGTTDSQETGLAVIPSRRLFDGLLEFMAASFPDPFTLDTYAPNLAALGGYPPIPHTEPQQKRSKPELMSLRFGDFPSASQSMPSAASSLMSSILLSVPFTVLQQVFQALGQRVIQNIARPILEERGRRRLQALGAGAKPTIDTGSSTAEDNQEWDGWEERIVETETGIAITRVPAEQN